MICYLFLCVLGVFGSQDKNFCLMSRVKKFKSWRMVLWDVSSNNHISFLVWAAKFTFENYFLESLDQSQTKIPVCVGGGGGWTEAGGHPVLEVCHSDLQNIISLMITERVSFIVLTYLKWCQSIHRRVLVEKPQSLMQTRFYRKWQVRAECFLVWQASNCGVTVAFNIID